MNPSAADTEAADAGTSERVFTSSAARLVRIIEAVATSDDGVGVRALARSTGIDKSAVSRLLRQLVDLGIVDVGPVGRYVAGPRLFALARAAVTRDELTRAARPILETLVRDTEETCYLSVLDKDQHVYRDVVETSRVVRYVAPLGQGSSLHAGAGGRAILAALPLEEREAFIVRANLVRHTDNTITDRRRLRKVVAADQAKGYSVSEGERFAGGCAVASPFFGADGRCGGSIVIAFPRERLAEHDVVRLGRAVKRAAAQLSRRLGFVPREPASA